MTPLLGVIADDFTGATDIACTLAKHGMSVVQLIGLPDENFDLQRLEQSNALVVALKTRTCPVSGAVETSRAALRWLMLRECQQYFFKYCSTFDSTPKGNIGPVADALLEDLNQDFAVVCPAFPSNGRTIYHGHLFVGDQLLSESPLRDHPLTPMRDSSLVRLMSAQSSHSVGLVTYATVSAGSDAIDSAFTALREKGITYAVTDALNDAHLYAIANALRSHRLVTGASALAAGLAGNFKRDGQFQEYHQSPLPKIDGRTAIVAGSCSQATLAQVDFARKVFPYLKLDVARIARGEDVVPEVMEWAARNRDKPLLIFSSASPADTGNLQDQFGQEQLSEALESSMTRLSRSLIDQGITRIVVAGGETSGAIVSGLGIQALEIGPEIDTGVPWTMTLGEPRLALALKSGNFGKDDFFVRAVEMLR